jgi:hypothetical protein
MRGTRRGAPCKQRRLGAGGRCKFHGGASTGPKTAEGRQAIAAAQAKRHAEARAARPYLFQSEISASQERKIKRAFRQAKALQRETRNEIERKLGPDWFNIIERRRQELHTENARARERNKRLTPEQIAQADAFLERWAALTAQPNNEAREELRHLASRGYTVRSSEPSSSQQWVVQMIEPPTTRFADTGPKQAERPAVSAAQKLRAQIDRQPSHRIKRLEYEERQRLIEAHALELIERHGLNKRPTVRVGYASKKRR